MTPRELLPKIDHWLELGVAGSGPGCGHALTDEQAARYAKEPEAVIEALTGVTFAQWWAWREAGGLPSCLATTRTGQQCKGRVPGVLLQSPAAWAAYSGGYCSAHGGDRPAA
ncbi:hypothetical protein LJR084_001905 [Variovorax sp. LjRoot84]|uniref:hypothetical protein n=1 Tax=Variovorax sp. LjRoot84 TaxID=3342340 RepID=UPI003ECF22E5